MARDTTVLYGIPNCDTVKKARTWLTANGIAHRFHDFRKDGLDTAMLQGWMQRAGWQTLLNTRGTTWRKLPETARAYPDEASARDLMLEQPSLIKRPVVEAGEHLLVGFDPETWQQTFSRG